MPNAKDLSTIPDRFSVLVVGAPKSGKSTLIGTMPPGEVYVADFDNKVRTTLRGKDIDFDVFKDAAHGTTPTKESGLYKYGEGWSAFMKKLDEIGKMIDAGTCPYKILCFDSISMMAELAMNNVLKNDGVPGKAPQIQHWGALNRTISEAINVFTGWPLIKYMTAHITKEENDLLKTIEMLPMLPGKLAGKVPAYFDEVYYMEVEGSGANIKYNLLLKPTGLIKQAGSCFGIKEAKVEASWPKLMDLIRAVR